MSNLRRLKVVFFAAILTAACTMPSTKIYSLYLPEEMKSPGEPTDISLTISVASVRYLAQPYIAYRTSPYQLEVSGYAKWEDAPADLVREAFRRCLEDSGLFKEVRVSRFSKEESYSLEIYVRKFERLEDEGVPYGELGFDARLFSPGGRELYSSGISRRLRLQDRGFLSLAKALSTGLLAAIEEVKVEVAKVITAGGNAAESK